MTEPLPPRPPLSAWQALSLRLTLFADVGALPLDVKGWWQSVTGESPETTLERPRLGTRKDDGKFLGGQLALDVQAQRVDWELLAAVGPDADLPDFLALGEYPSVRDLFITALQPWLSHAPPSVRLAFGCRLALPAEDRFVCYRILESFLPVSIDAPRTNDFQYRVNHRCTSQSVPGLEINRMQTWSAAYLRFGALLAGLPTPLPGRDKNACLLELDVNTAAELAVVLPHDRASALLGEFVGLGNEIVAKGDRP
jgi:hypothetical protein